MPGNAPTDQTIKADAVAFRENLLFEVKQQASEELDLAQTSRIESDSYRERIIAQTRRQAEDTFTHARLIAEQGGTEINQKHAIEAQKVPAHDELIKAAAEEQFEAQRLLQKHLTNNRIQRGPQPGESQGQQRKPSPEPDAQASASDANQHSRSQHFMA